MGAGRKTASPPRDRARGTAELSQAEFERLRTLIKEQAGIKLGTGKETLLKARLSKRLRSLGLDSFSDYIAVLDDDRSGAELTELLDAIATNVTSFFRQPTHFTYLRNVVMPGLVERDGGRRRRLRIWSAACSTGEEPYSIGIQLREGLPNLDSWDAKILATDLSTKALDRVCAGVYEPSKLVGFPDQYARRYLTKAGASYPQGSMQFAAPVRDLVTFARLNLMGAWTMRGPFDAIFCRNVMIYFDKPTQARLVGRFLELLAPGGTLFIGHSESLSGIQDGYRCAGPAIYSKA